MPVLTRLVLDWCNKYGKTRDLETVCYSLAGNPDCDYKVIIFKMDLDVGVCGRVTSPRNGSMASVQVGKAVFVKESYTTLGIEPRTYS